MPGATSVAMNCVQIAQSGYSVSVALAPIHDAKLSLSHRSFHHAIVTRSPEPHMRHLMRDDLHDALPRPRR